MVARCPAGRRDHWLACGVLVLAACSTTLSDDNSPGGIVDADIEQSDAMVAPLEVEILASGLVTGSNGTSFNHVNLAVDDSGVYLPSFGINPDFIGTVSHVPLMGGAPTALTTPLPSPQYVSLSDTDVYFSSYYGGWVGSVAKEGGVVSHWVEGMASPVHTVKDGADLFWNNNGDSTVRRLGDGGGESIILAEGQTTCLGLAIDAERVYWVAWGPTTDEGWVRMVPKGGGTPVDLASAQVKPDTLHLDSAGMLYFRSGNKTAITKVPATGGAPSMVVSGSSTLEGIVSDATRVIYGDQTGGAIVAVDKAGGEPTILVPNQLEPFALTISDGYLYWLSGMYQPTQDLKRIELR